MSVKRKKSGLVISWQRSFSILAPWRKGKCRDAVLDSEVVLTKMKLFSHFLSSEDSVSTATASKSGDFLSAIFSERFESEDSGVELPSGANSPSTPTGSEQSFIVHSRDSSVHSEGLDLERAQDSVDYSPIVSPADVDQDGPSGLSGPEGDEDLGGPCEDLRGHCEDLGGPCEDLRGPCEDLRGPCEDLGGPCEDLRGPCENLGGPCEDLRGPCEDLRGPCEDLRGPCEDLRGPCEDLGGPCEDLRGPCEDLRGHCEDLGGPCEDLRGPCEDLRGPCEDLRGPCEDLRGHCEDLRGPCEDLGGPCEDLVPDLESLGRSPSRDSLEDYMDQCCRLSETQTGSSPLGSGLGYLEHVCQLMETIGRLQETNLKLQRRICSLETESRTANTREDFLQQQCSCGAAAVSRLRQSPGDLKTIPETSRSPPRPPLRPPLRPPRTDGECPSPVPLRRRGVNRRSYTEGEVPYLGDNEDALFVSPRRLSESYTWGRVKDLVRKTRTKTNSRLGLGLGLGQTSLKMSCPQLYMPDLEHVELSGRTRNSMMALGQQSRLTDFPWIQ